MDVKFSGKIKNCSTVRYTKFRDDRQIRSRAVLGKPEGGGLHPPQPPVPASVNTQSGLFALLSPNGRSMCYFRAFWSVFFYSYEYCLKSEACPER